MRLRCICSGGLIPNILTRPVQCCSGDTASGRGRRTCTGSEGDRWSYLQRGLRTWQRQRCWRTGRLRSRKTPCFQPDWWSGEKRKYIFQKSVWIVSWNQEWMHQNVLKRTNALENNALNICIWNTLIGWTELLRRIPQRRCCRMKWKFHWEEIWTLRLADQRSSQQSHSTQICRLHYWPPS